VTPRGEDLFARAPLPGARFLCRLLTVAWGIATIVISFVCSQGPGKDAPAERQTRLPAPRKPPAGT
jgi:hypothetical protein